MSADLAITLVIGAGAAIYLGRIFTRSAKRLLAPKSDRACGGCSGCGTAEGHSDDKDSCGHRKERLVVLGHKTPTKAQ